MRLEERRERDTQTDREAGREIIVEDRYSTWEYIYSDLR